MEAHVTAENTDPNQAPDPSLALIIFPPGEKINDGVLRAIQGGTLVIMDDIVGSGKIVAQGRYSRHQQCPR